jgi:hypothetical protein
MEQVPKIVRERLQAVAAPGIHPDENLLTGFAEKSLMPREQGQVLEHLASCAACREVIACAQPQFAEERVAAVAAAAPRSEHHFWFRGKMLRWAGLAACVAIVGSAVGLHYQRREQRQVLVASNSEAVATKAMPPAAAPQSVEAIPTDDKKSTVNKKAVAVVKERESDQLQDLQKAQAENSQSASTNGGRGEDLSVIAGMQKQPTPAAPVEMTRAAAPPPALPKSNDPEAAKKVFSADKVMKVPLVQNGRSDAVAKTNDAVSINGSAATAPVMVQGGQVALDQKAAPEASDGVMLYKSKDAFGASAGAMRSSLRLPQPHWQLSPDGKIMRSRDLGDTWQSVDVGKSIIFHALCVTGAEVWVGGAEGNLFYSSDAGAHWEQIRPSTQDITLTADITAIEFIDPKHGKVTTSNRQTWITANAGRTWELKQ